MTAKPLTNENPYGLYGFPNMPVRKEPDPIADLTVDQIRELAKRLGDDSSELGSVKATLAVNCKEGRRLAEFGCAYDEKKSGHNNMLFILERLCNLIDERDATIRRRDELIRHQFGIDMLHYGRCELCREIEAIVEAGDGH